MDPITALNEIIRQATEAKDIWNQDAPVRTNIRDACFDRAIEIEAIAIDLAAFFRN